MLPVRIRRYMTSVPIIIAALTDALPAQSPTSSRVGTAAPSPAIALPPALNRVLRDYESAWTRGDAAALAALFAEDGFVLQSGRAPVRGRAAIQAAYAGQGGGAPLTLRALAASEADTIGYIIGTYSYNDSPTDAGKFTLTLRRRPGGPWQIFSDMDNTSRAPK